MYSRRYLESLVSPQTTTSTVFISTTTAITPPAACTLCEPASFYRRDFCPVEETDGCIAIDTTSAVKNITTPNGCHQSEIICPDDSYVYIRSGADSIILPATQVKTTTEEIYCDDTSVWILQNLDHLQLDQATCYYKECSRCPMNLITTGADCLPGSTCVDPVDFKYVGLGFAAPVIKFASTDNSAAEVLRTQLEDPAFMTVKCNPNGWMVNIVGQAGALQLDTVRCVV